MEYKTYVQKLQTLEAYYDDNKKSYHVKYQNGESDVSKDVFERGWEEQKEVVDAEGNTDNPHP